MKEVFSRNRSEIISMRLLIFQIVAGIIFTAGIAVCKHSEVQADTVDIAVESFAAPSWDIGTGWSDAWFHEGNADIISTEGPHSASHHMCLRAGDAWIDRPLNLSNYKNARLGLYVKVNSFENDDHAELMVKFDNNDWQSLRRFSSSDSNNSYQYYEFELGPYGLASNVWIGFEAEMDGADDYLYVDDIRVFADETPIPPGTDPIFGVTIDDISDAGAIKDSLSSLARRPTARIVFDVDEVCEQCAECAECGECEECEGIDPSYYEDTVADLHGVADVMGEIVDSYYVRAFTQEAYEKRTLDYVNAMAEDVDIWEVGNEINGEWLKNGAIDKAEAAYNIVKAAGEKAALTLYYNGTYDSNCWKFPEEQMQDWARKNVPEHMKQGIDYVFVSFYDEDCNIRPPDWEKIFADLHKIFPNSKLGFGEVGYGKPDEEAKETILRRYYGMNRIRSEFVGGFFWWYFKQDMVPKSTEDTPNYLWDTLNGYAQSWDQQYN